MTSISLYVEQQKAMSGLSNGLNVNITCDCHCARWCPRTTRSTCCDSHNSDSDGNDQERYATVSRRTDLEAQRTLNTHRSAKCQIL